MEYATKVFDSQLRHTRNRKKAGSQGSRFPQKHVPNLHIVLLKPGQFERLVLLDQKTNYTGSKDQEKISKWKSLSSTGSLSSESDSPSELEEEESTIRHGIFLIPFMAAVAGSEQLKPTVLDRKWKSSSCKWIGFYDELGFVCNGFVCK